MPAFVRQGECFICLAKRLIRVSQDPERRGLERNGNRSHVVPVPRRTLDGGVVVGLRKLEVLQRGPALTGPIERLAH